MDETRRDIHRTRRDMDETVRDLDETLPSATGGSEDLLPYAEPGRSGRRRTPRSRDTGTSRPGDAGATRPGDTGAPGPGDAGASRSEGGATLRFGPGVPAEVARRWSGAGRRRRLARRIAGGLLTLGIAVLAGLIVWWLLRGGPGVAVTGVSVSAPATTRSCDATVRLVGTIRTNGGYGDVRYRWRRSDGQVSGVLSESVRKGQRSVQVPLRWTVKGEGSLHAVATLEIVQAGGPGPRASGAFEYICG